MKKDSQLFTFAEIVRRNVKIFSKRFEKGFNEPDSHYICKVYLGEQIKKHYNNKIEVTYEYSGLPVLGTEKDPRHYLPDLFCFYINQKDKKINVSIIEINGGVHYASKHQYNKTKFKRESITDYFTNYTDKRYENYPIVFSYLTFGTDDFLYNKLDYFLDIFDDKFFNGGRHPSKDLYEEIFL